MPFNDETQLDPDKTTGDDRADGGGSNGDSIEFSSTPAAPSFFEDTARVDFEVRARGTQFELPYELGNYTLTEKVGEGGVGIVYRATSNIDQSIVAVKVLRPEVLGSKKAVQRFEKEARVQAGISNQYVTRHIEFGTENGQCYMVAEFVEGKSLKAIAHSAGRLKPSVALHIVRDILRALDALHSGGVVHRDVKPENVMVLLNQHQKSGNQWAEGPTSFSLDDYRQIKLTDFGLARHVDQSQSLAMTKQTAILGTPLYMAPEQHTESRSVDARADIYSVGATLYHLVAGHPPLEGEDFVDMARLHCEERPVALSKVCDDVSEALSDVVAKTLEKDPELRYESAAEMLGDIERLLAGEPTSIRLFPATPDRDHKRVKKYRFTWVLDAGASVLWPMVADTDRLNRAIGLPVPKFSYEQTGKHRQTVAEASFNGVKVRWLEHPFEWIRERYLSVLREFDVGPFTWVTSTVELEPLLGGRTRLVHSFQVLPRSILGRLLTPLQFGLLTKRSLGHVYRRLEAMAKQTETAYACDGPFGKPVKLDRAAEQRLADRTDVLKKNFPAGVVDQLSNYMVTVADPIAARVRPNKLAKSLKCSAEVALELCIRSVPAGVMTMSWDVICPVCRIASSNVSTLEGIEQHGNCEACNLEFEVKFAESVELVFGVHSEIRTVDAGIYCIGGPFQSPHVISQSRLKMGDRIDVGTRFADGAYQVRSPQLNQAWQISADSVHHETKAKIGLSDTGSDLLEIVSGPACVTIDNDSQSELLVRLEHKSDRVDAVTAAEATSHQLFRHLFPDQVKHARQLVELKRMYLLSIWDGDFEATIAALGDVGTRSCWSAIKDMVAGSGGELIEISDDSAVFGFEKQATLFNSIGDFKNRAQELPVEQSSFSFGVHCGEIISGNETGQSKYFGPALRELKKAMGTVKEISSAILYSAEVKSDGEIVASLEEIGAAAEDSEVEVGRDRWFKKTLR